MIFSRWTIWNDRPLQYSKQKNWEMDQKNSEIHFQNIYPNLLYPINDCIILQILYIGSSRRFIFYDLSFYVCWSNDIISSPYNTHVLLNIYFRFPYVNEKTPIGYLFISLFTIASLYYLLTIIFCILFIHFGFCILLMTFPIDVKQNINKIEEKIKVSISQKGKFSKTEVVEIKKSVRDIIQFHGDAKQLSRKRNF